MIIRITKTPILWQQPQKNQQEKLELHADFSVWPAPTQGKSCGSVTTTSFRSKLPQKNCILEAEHEGKHAYNSCKTCDAPAGRCAFGKHAGN